MIMKATISFARISIPCFALMLVMGCEGGSGGDSPDMAPAAISGNSGLEVRNNSENEANVFFDDVFIGNIAPSSTGKWSVPHGTHRIRITNAEKRHVVPLLADYNFPSGGRVILELKFVPKPSTADTYNAKS